MEENQSRNVKDPVSTNNDVSEKSFQIVTSIEDHPLMNIVILDNIIRHLDYKDLKNLRLVCRRWRDVAKNVFWKLTRIKVYCNEKVLENELEERALELPGENQMLTDTFESIFPSPAGLPTNAIRFTGNISPRTLEYFWKKRGLFTLTSVHFNFLREATKESIDLNSFITPKLTTLNIGFSQRNNFKISLKMLANIQNLSLCRCKIILDGKITPKELNINACRVLYERKLYVQNDPENGNAQKILINEFVDLSKINKLILRSNFWRLDVGRDTKELEHLALGDIELNDFRNCQWKTNIVDIGSCICIGDKMKINSIVRVDSADQLDLESLPHIVEHLWFRICSSYFSLPQPLIFAYPKLKSLTIVMFMRPNIRILDFTNCSSLVDFHLRNASDVYQLDFNRIKLPSSIKNVKLLNVIPNTDAPWQLDTLVLYKCPFSAVEGAFRYFATAKLAVELNSKLELEEDLMIIINHWRNSSVEQLALRYLGIDGIKRFSLFTNKSNVTGEAIDSDRFKKLSNLNVPKAFLPFMI